MQTAILAEASSKRISPAYNRNEAYIYHPTHVLICYFHSLKRIFQLPSPFIACLGYVMFAMLIALSCDLKKESKIFILTTKINRT